MAKPCIFIVPSSAPTESKTLCTRSHCSTFVLKFCSSWHLETLKLCIIRYKMGVGAAITGTLGTAEAWKAGFAHPGVVEEAFTTTTTTTTTTSLIPPPPLLFCKNAGSGLYSGCMLCGKCACRRWGPAWHCAQR